MTSHEDIIIIGGGPAGSTTAALLASRGFDVTVFESETFPRPHVGESLLPTTLAILEQTGVLPAIEAEGFLKKWGATMCWGRDQEPWSWLFKETNRRFPHSYQVSRPRFDQILLEHAAACGARVYEQTPVKSISMSGARAVGVELADGAHHNADMIVDASGQSALLSRQLDLRQWDTYFRNLAVYAYFSGAAHLEGIDAGNIFIESFDDGWSWKIPLADGQSSIGLVVDRDIGARSIREVGLAAYFDTTIARLPRTHSMLRAATRTSEPIAVRDWSYRATQFAGDGFCLVGDAACFVDPLFSTGVHLAVTGAFFAAAYVTTTRANPALADAARDAYQRLYVDQYTHFYELARLFYSANHSSDGYFWETRRITGDDALPRSAFVRAVSGQAAQGYERAVLNHGVLPEAFTRALDDAASTRETTLDAIERSDLLDMTLRLDSNTSLVEAAVLGDESFQQGYVLRGEDRVDLPVSTPIAHLIHRLNGASSAADLAAEIARDTGADVDALLQVFESALPLLLSDGIVHVT